MNQIKEESQKKTPPPLSNFANVGGNFRQVGVKTCLGYFFSLPTVLSLGTASHITSHHVWPHQTPHNSSQTSQIEKQKKTGEKIARPSHNTKSFPPRPGARVLGPPPAPFPASARHVAPPPSPAPQLSSRRARRHDPGRHAQPAHPHQRQRLLSTRPGTPAPLFPPPASSSPAPAAS